MIIKIPKYYFEIMNNIINKNKEYVLFDQL